MLKILKKFTLTEWLLSAIAVGFIVVMVWLELSMPDYMDEITKLVLTPGTQMSSVMSAGGKMIACALGSLLSSVIVAIISSKVAANFSANIRNLLFNKVQSFSLSEIGRFSTASLITRSTNDVTQVQMLIVMGLQMLIKAPIMAVWAICKIAGKNWQWTLSTGIAVLILLLLVAVCIIFALPKFKKIQLLTDDINRVTRENLTGLNVVRAYNAESFEHEKFETANNALTDTNLFANRVMSFLMPCIQLLLSGLSLAVYWIGASLINNANITDKLPLFSDMVVFLQYAVQVIMSFMMLVMIFIMLPRSAVAAKRINEVLETKLDIHDGAITDTPGVSGEIEFKNVSFSYPDGEEYVLENITFSAHRGETVAIIGSTGCGKSTLINLIPRFYDVSKGEVLVNGVNVKEYNQKSLRNKIGYVSQKAILFSGTVQSNIAFGDNGKNEFSADIMENAVETAQAKEFIDNLPCGYEAFISQGGSNLSGGQKQRLSIARAVARKPDIFIFDDSFSALDYKTDKNLRAALAEECGDATRLIVAQRIGTIRDADKIIVLDDGKIAGQGSHNELMNSCEVYKQIAYSQLSKEELE